MSDPVRPEIDGPYHYNGDTWPCLRIEWPDRIVAVVYIVDGEVNRARDEAEIIAEALAGRALQQQEGSG